MTEPDPRDKYMLQIRRGHSAWQCLVQSKWDGWTLWASPLVATAERALAEGRKALRRMGRQDRRAIAIALVTSKKKETK